MFPGGLPVERVDDYPGVFRRPGLEGLVEVVRPAPVVVRIAQALVEREALIDLGELDRLARG